jgi:hypothetical protein
VKHAPERLLRWFMTAQMSFVRLPPGKHILPDPDYTQFWLRTFAERHRYTLLVLRKLE